MKLWPLVSVLFLASILAQNVSAEIRTISGDKYFVIGSNQFRLGPGDKLTEEQVGDILHLTIVAYERMDKDDVEILKTLWKQLSVVYRGSKYDDIMLVILRAHFNIMFDGLRLENTSSLFHGEIKSSKKKYGKGFSYPNEATPIGFPYRLLVKTWDYYTTITETMYHDTKAWKKAYSFKYMGIPKAFYIRFEFPLQRNQGSVSERYTLDLPTDVDVSGHTDIYFYYVGNSDELLKNYKVYNYEKRFHNDYVAYAYKKGLKVLRSDLSGIMKKLYSTVTPRYSIRKNYQIDNLMIKVVKKANKQLHKDVAKAYAEAFLPYFNSTQLKNELLGYCSGQGINVEVSKAKPKDF